MRLPGKTDLDALREQLAQAISECDRAALTVEEAEQAKAELDGLDPAEWTMAEADLAAARSELERCEQSVSTLYGRCATEAHRLARIPVERAEDKIEKLDARIAEAEATLVSLRAAREPIQAELEDATEALREARVPFLDPASSEFAAHRERERQHRETLTWALRHPAHDVNLSRKDREWVAASTRATQPGDSRTA